MSLMVVQGLDRPDLLRDMTVQHKRGPENSSQAKG